MLLQILGLGLDLGLCFSLWHLALCRNEALIQIGERHWTSTTRFFGRCQWRATVMHGFGLSFFNKLVVPLPCQLSSHLHGGGGVRWNGRDQRFGFAQSFLVDAYQSYIRFCLVYVGWRLNPRWFGSYINSIIPHISIQVIIFSKYHGIRRLGFPHPCIPPPPNPLIHCKHIYNF